MTKQNNVKFVDHLPDLMTSEDYLQAHSKKHIRLQLKLTDNGLEILGDSPYPELLDELISALEPHQIEKVLCG